jgi:type IV pilus assembly protein PilM
MFSRSSLIAVDIGTSSVKMLELSGSAKSRKLKSFGMEALPPGAIEDGAIHDVSAVKNTLAKVASTMGVLGRRAAIALSGSGVLIKKMSVPIGKDVILEEQIPFHAEQAFQVDPTGLYYDFAIVPSFKSTPDTAEIILVGARREMVEQFVACVKDAGLKLGVIECNAISLANAFEQNHGIVQGLLAIVNVGASYTQVVFLHNGVFLFCRDIPIGGLNYTRRIMELSGMPFDQAESLKIACATSPNRQGKEQVVRIFQEVNEQLVHEISGTVNYFLRSGDVDQGQPLRHVFMSGGASRTPGLDTAIASATQASVFAINPFQHISVSESKFGINRILAMAPVAAVAVGLGLREFGDKG